LEREVREFIIGATDEDGEVVQYEESVHDEEDSDEEEIVFVSKRERRAQEAREKVLFQGEEGDKSASFG
jgi:riboflavin synthase